MEPSTRNDPGDDHDPSMVYILVRARQHCDPKFFRRVDRAEISLADVSHRMVPEPVAVAVAVILHLAVASAGGRAASTRRK